MTDERTALADELERVRQLVREHIGPTMDKIIKRSVAALRAPLPETRTCATCHAVLADGPQPAATYSALPTSRPFYGAECPSYPDCNGGCGLGCTKEIEQTRAVEGGVVEGKVFEARNRGNTFGRFVQDTLRKAVDEEAALSHPNTGDGK